MKKNQPQGKVKRMFGGGKLISRMVDSGKLPLPPGASVAAGDYESTKAMLKDFFGNNPMVGIGGGGGSGGGPMGIDLEELVKKAQGRSQGMAKGGAVTRGDGCASRGKTKGRMI